MMSRPATVKDLFAVELQPMQQATDPRPFIGEDATDGDLNALVARTMENEGKVLACYGLLPTLPGMAEAWALLSEESLKYPKWLTRDVKYWLEWGMKEYQLRRVQATASEEHPAAHRWLLRLGFECEGCLRAYGFHGENHWVYGRI